LNQTDGGLYYINGDLTTRYTEKEGLPGKTIQNVEVATDDTVWFSWRDIFVTEPFNQLTSGGVCHFDGTNIEVYRPAEGLADNIVNDIAVSSEGIVWFATDAGLSTLDLNKEPEPKIRTGVNKYNVKAGDEFKLGINLQNRGMQKTVKLVTALIYNDAIFYFDFASGQFTSNFTALQVTLPENLKFNTEIWKIDVPTGLEGVSIIFGSALLDGRTSNIIGDVSTETVNFIE
jgi:hypothetical protein